jgi:anti-anti-sigma factor
MRLGGAFVSPHLRHGYHFSMTTDRQAAGGARRVAAPGNLPLPRAPADQGLRSQVRWRSADAIVVEVAGEIDLCTVTRLESMVRDQLRARPAVLRVDLGEVGFLGASGISVLLRAQLLAQETGVHLVVDPGGSRAALRALELLDLLDAETPPTPSRR